MVVRLSIAIEVVGMAIGVFLEEAEMSAGQ